MVGSVAFMSTSVPHAVVIYHPLKTDVAELKAAVARAESSAGWLPTRWHATSADEAGGALATQAVADGASVVIAAGGDGTVRAVAEGLRGSGVPLAIVPEGTGNLLARNIGLPLNDTQTALQAAFAGNTMAIDLGVLTIIRPDETEEEHAFLVLAGMGLDARLINATSSTLKKRLGWLAYVDAGVRSFFRDSPLRIHYSVDGAAVKNTTVYTVMIGNCGLLPGGVLLIPDAQLNDGKLDVVAIRPLGAFAWLRIWQHLGWENMVLRRTKTGRRMINLTSETRAVNYLQAKRYSVSVAAPEPVQLDGDDFGLALAVRGTVDPASLLLRVLPEWQRKVPA